MVSAITNGSPIIQSEADNEVTIFLAGGYGTDWRDQVKARVEAITPSEIKIIFYDPTNDNADLMKRTKWENSAMDVCDIFACYLPNNGIHPISLYELGKCNEMMANVVLGVEEGYECEENIIDEVKINALGNPKTKILEKADPAKFADLLLVEANEFINERKAWGEDDGLSNE